MSTDSSLSDKFNAWRANQSGFLGGRSSPSHWVSGLRALGLDYAKVCPIVRKERTGRDSPVLVIGSSLNRLGVREMRAIDSRGKAPVLTLSWRRRKTVIPLPFTMRPGIREPVINLCEGGP
ncbi:hypothetical protein Patl1_26204 [Pistacia atlantica]|uniref:Uncharacterized protein n=1 Tax=Pistacia atlantica TaxID=434234 RepID=A0ACC1B193_9ROSI|nr:hypothetical protein Patl1_26204 [Pistacia atlantica]